MPMPTPYAKSLQDASVLLLDAFLAQDAPLREAGRSLDSFVLKQLMFLGEHLVTQLADHLAKRLSNEARQDGFSVQRAPSITFTSLFGPITVPSPYLTHPSLPSRRPLKDHFGLVGNRFTDAVDRAMTDFGADRSFSRAQSAMKEHYQLDVDRAAIRRRTLAVARRAGAFVEKQFTQAEHLYDLPKIEREPAEALLAELDGCYLPTARFMTAGQARHLELEIKREDALDGDVVRLDAWTEVRTGFVRGLEEEDKTYVCKRASYEEICHELFGAACLHGLGPDTRVIAPGDGGNGLRAGLEFVFPNLEFRLDPTHLKDNLYRCADGLGLRDGEKVGWVRSNLDRIWKGEVTDVLKCLREDRISRDEKLESNEYRALGRLIGYIEDHEDAVAYVKYREEKTPMGSGEVESAHRYVPQERLKIPAARWRLDHINPMLALRVIRANGWWEHFWIDEHQHRMAA